MATRNPKPGEDFTPPASDNTPSYVKAATRLSASRPLGAPTTDFDIITLKPYSAPEDISVSNTKECAGIMVLDYLPTLGVSTSATSALNRAVFNEFNKIRCQISGNRSYEPVDHMIYRICVDSIRDLYIYMTRIYGVLATYSAENLYRPRAILSSMGLDFEDWNSHAAELYQWLHNTQGALKPFPTVPIGSMTARHNAFNMGFYTDGDTPKAQTFIINQIGYYSYEKVDEVKGVTIVRPGSTYQDFIDTWNRMYYALQTSSDAYTMAADIRRAFGDAVVTDLTPPEAGYTVPYVKHDTILASIMNCSSIGSFDVMGDLSGVIETQKILDAFRIQDGGDGTLVVDPKWVVTISAPNSAYTATAVNLGHLNFIEDEPDSSAVLAAVRLKPVVKNIVRSSIADTSKVVCTTEVKSMGTEVVFGMRIIDDVDQDVGDMLEFGTANLVSTGQAFGAQKIIGLLGARSVFDWCPPIVVIDFDLNEETKIIGDHIFEDVQNYVPITADVQQQIFDASLLAEFGVQ